MEDTNTVATKLPARRNSDEANRKMKERAVWGSPEMKSFRESIQGKFNLDIRDKKSFPVDSPDFNWGKFQRRCYARDELRICKRPALAGRRSDSGQQYVQRYPDDL